MTISARTALVALALAAAGPTLAAAGTLDAWAARHFNVGVSAADRQSEPAFQGRTLMTRGEAGSALSVRAAEHFNRSVSIADRQTVIAPTAAPDPALDARAAQHFNVAVSVADRQSY